MKVTCTWDDGTTSTLETYQVDEIAAEDAGFGGPDGVRTDPDPDSPDGVRTVAINPDGTEFSTRQMVRHMRASAKAALERVGDPRAADFDRRCLSVMPGDEADPTDPAQPGT